MVILVRLLGLIIMVFGIIYLFKPNTMKTYIDFWKTGKKIRIGAFLSLIIGIIFLLAAGGCRVSWFVTLFGVLALIKGIVLFVISQEQAVSILEWWKKRPIAFLRTHALFALVIGALLIYSA